MKFLATLATLSKAFASQVQARDERYLKAKDSGDSIMFTKIAQPARVARYVAAFGVAALSCGAASAHADPVANQVTMAGSTQTVVAYPDLDLSKESDVRSLYERLQRAAKRVCGQEDLRNLHMKRLQNECYQESLGRAVDDVGHASVKAIFVADERIRLASRASKTSART
jgi:UrcA family protein